VELTDEQRMLVTIRDTLYDGKWDDFERDLRDRQAGRPYVFELLPPSDRLRATIASHLAIIDGLRRWEKEHGVTLHAD